MSKSFCDDIVYRLKDYCNITYRSMFGGYGLYFDGIIFALVADKQLYLKVDDSNRKYFEDYGCSPFEYVSKGKQMKMSYYLIPDEVFDDCDKLYEWSLRSYNISLMKK